MSYYLTRAPRAASSQVIKHEYGAKSVNCLAGGCKMQKKLNETMDNA